MHPKEYGIMRSVEDTYWWYRALRSLTLQSIDKRLQNGNQAIILDAGCGTGGMMEVLEDKLPIAKLIGIDADRKAIDFTKQRNVGFLARASVNHLPFPPKSFDFVISLDVLYMQGVDDAGAIKEFDRVLKSNGYLILNLPAFEFLRGRHDRAIKTARRYTKQRIRELLVSAGFKIETLMYWNSTLFPAVVGWRVISRLSPDEEGQSDLVTLPNFLNSFLTWMIHKELQIVERIPSPFGSSVFSVSRKAR
jgi:SAM-dependent methyltransferase